MFLGGFKYVLVKFSRAWMFFHPTAQTYEDDQRFSRSGFPHNSRLQMTHIVFLFLVQNNQVPHISKTFQSNFSDIFISAIRSLTSPLIAGVSPSTCPQWCSGLMFKSMTVTRLIMCMLHQRGAHTAASRLNVCLREGLPQQTAQGLSSEAAT